MLTTAGKVKETLLMGTLNIGLPTADVYSDGALIYDYYTGYNFHPDCENWLGNETHGELKSTNKTCLTEMVAKGQQLHHEYHYTWATMLLVPFILNYFAGWLAWYRNNKQKKFTWLACLLNLYPQLRVAQAIREMWRNPNKGHAKKKKLETEVSQAEIFLEAVPTVFILSSITRRGFGKFATRSNQRFAHSQSEDKFFLALFTSMASAGLGLAKTLKVS